MSSAEIESVRATFTAATALLASGDPSGAGERLAMEQLGRLYRLLADSGQWSGIRSHVAALRAAGPRGAANLHQLTLYEGTVAVNTSQFPEAERMLQALLAERELDPALRLRALNQLAGLHLYTSRYAQSVELFREVGRQAQALGDRFYQAVALLNTGMAYNDLHQHAAAIELTEASLTLFLTLGDQAHEAIARYELGNNALWMGRWQLAEQSFDAAIALAEQLALTWNLTNMRWGYGWLYHLRGELARSEAAYLRGLESARNPQHPDELAACDMLWFLGFLYATAGRADEALSAFDQALELAHAQSRPHWVSLIQYQRGNLLRRQGALPMAEAAYDAAITAVEALRSATPNDDIKISLLGTTQHVFEATVLHYLEAGRPAEAFAYAERARARALLDSLAAHDPELLPLLDVSAASLADVQAALPPDALLLAYFTTGVVPRGDHLLNRLPPEAGWLREHLCPPPQTLLFAITSVSFESHRIHLDPNYLRPAPGDPSAGRHLLDDELLEELYDKLIQPAAHLLPGRRRLYLVPHGPLHYLPFAALRHAESYLLDADGPALVYAPSATLLRSTLRRGPVGSTALALGYNSSGMDALRFAEAEARLMAALTAGTAHTGPAPKGALLAAALPTLGALHIAGHGVYDPSDPLGSYLEIGAGERLSARAIIGGPRIAAHLVTLGACMSGLCHVAAGDELLGLSRALLYAGASAVVSALWDADDCAALLLMDTFYRAVRAGSAPAEALHNAQIALRTATATRLAALLTDWPAAAGPPPDLSDLFPTPNDQFPFADPTYWAPFLLLGRA